MKTDKTKNWTDSWKEQLDEYSVTPPPEVWEELSKELAPRRIPLRKRTIWWAAACITLLLCTFIGLQFLRPTTDLISRFKQKYPARSKWKYLECKILYPR